jgi:hypothetical protein
MFSEGQKLEAVKLFKKTGGPEGWPIETFQLFNLLNNQLE